MRRFIVLATVFLFFSIGFVSAQSCDDSQTILKLHDATNSHAETWNGAGGYLIDICYDDIFGKTYDGTNPHDCVDVNGDGKPENAIIRLSGITNAHAEYATKNTNGYNYVCYGDLDCKIGAYLPGENNCGTLYPGYEGVLALGEAYPSGYTPSNLHLGVYQEPVVNPEYNTFLCCKISQGGLDTHECSDGVDNDDDGKIDYPADPGCVNADDDDETDLVDSCDLTSASWDKTNANEGEQVGLTVQGSPECNGLTVSFVVEEYDGPLNDPDPVQINPVNAVFNNGVAKTTWKAEYQVDGAGDPEYKFTANSANKEIDSSNYLSVAQQNGGGNLEANITAPVHKGIYFKDTSVTFTQNSGVENPEELSYLWTISEDNFQTNGASFNYKFNTEGQKTITLKVTNSSGFSKETQVAIVVIASPGIFAFINKPFHQQVVPEKYVNNVKKLLLEYNASDSYVVNSVADGNQCAPSITCLEGECPAKTQNSPVGCVGKINVQGPNKPYTAKSSFSWIFGDGSSNTTAGNKGGVKGAKLYGEKYSGDRVLNLIYSYKDPAAGLDLSKQTNRIFTLGQCVDHGTKWIEIGADGKSAGIFDTQQDLGVCAGADGLSGSYDDCCPSGFSCGDKCYQDVVFKDVHACADYVESSDCENDIAHIVTQDPGYDSDPVCGEEDENGNIVECSCDWNEEGNNGDGICFLKKSFADINGDPGDQPTCNLISTESECSGGYKTVSVTSQFSCNGVEGCSQSDAEIYGCVDKDIVVLCGSPSIDLPFFGLWQFIISLMFIFGIYFVNRKRG